ncbi:endolytic transglycosylase MltG [Rossellomorea vietnamensis]|uniref:Endolytic murein transglycosylase n=1 Tax=Rossellomorea vietnamensis TaxID=218284 RepID=A0A5D4MIP4_9BACI|nr:endolytic transglycosylase MltG [Rossellomorea vietnamensis]TYS00846.1 endolytic transglycosylase MltG [Rossellomorea vietnamensis]
MTENKKSKREILLSKLIERKEEAKVIRKIVGIIVIALFIIIGGTAVGGYLYIKSALKPVDEDNNKSVNVEIPIGSGVTSIGSILEDNGIIKNSHVFKYYVKFNNESGFQAGSYDLTPAMTLDEIINSLKTGKVMMEAEFTITVPEGYQLEQIAEKIAEKTPYETEEIVKKLDEDGFVKELIGRYPDLLKEEDILAENVKHPLEGYLYPSTYPFYEEEPELETIIDKMISQTQDVLTQYESSRADREFSVHQLLTLSSLVEEEATEKADRGKIASVFFNRLEKEMPLQTDPTVLYALGEHKSRTLYEDLEVDSPYNTYQNTGLPPGPIANAGLTSIEAALQPDSTEYLYFLASQEGTVYYSETLDEHNEKKAEYITSE